MSTSYSKAPHPRSGWRQESSRLHGSPHRTLQRSSASHLWNLLYSIRCLLSIGCMLWLQIARGGRADWQKRALAIQGASHHDGLHSRSMGMGSQCIMRPFPE